MRVINSALEKGDNDRGLAAAGREISREEGGYRLVPSSTMLNLIFGLKLCGRRRQTVPSDDDVQYGCGGCGMLRRVFILRLLIKILN